MQTPVIYKLDSKKKVRQWQAWVEEHEDGTATVHTASGLEGGKLSGIPIHIKVGKNLGKKSETTPVQQAEKEVRSKLEKQYKKGYVRDIREFRQTGVQKAQDFRKYHHHLPEIIWVEPKLDGLRSKIDLNGACSKNGDLWGSWVQETTWVQGILDLLDEDEEVDGEIYIHGLELPDIYSAVSKENDLTPQLEFWMFDTPDEETPAEIRKLRRDKFKDVQGVVIVEGELVNKDEIEDVNDHYVGEGFEGVMAYNPAGLYAYGNRTMALQKYKSFYDDEWTALGYRLDREGNINFIFKSDLGYEFEVRPKGTREFRQQLKEDAELLVGKSMTIRYQMLFRDTNIPQFPRIIAIRDYE